MIQEKPVVTINVSEPAPAFSSGEGEAHTETRAKVPEPPPIWGGNGLGEWQIDRRPEPWLVGWPGLCISSPRK